MYEIFDELRKAKGVSISEVARCIGISPSTLTDWRAGRYTPKMDKLEKLAAYFDVSVRYLQTGSDDDGFISQKESHLLDLFRKLNAEAQEKIIEYASMLVRLPENQKGQKSLGSNVG